MYHLHHNTSARWRRHAAAWALPFGLAAGTLPASAAVNDPVTQIVKGDAVDTPVQQKLGLVTVGAGCSGTLLNRFWVLTADHCVAVDGNKGGARAPLSLLKVRGSWTRKVATPTRVIRYYSSQNRDVALLFLGSGDLGPATQHKFVDGLITTTSKVRVFGRGVSTYARRDSTGRAIPTVQDGAYRSGDFRPNQVNYAWYRFNSQNGQIPTAGDSGAVQFLLVDGKPGGIVGVHSTTKRSYLSGMPESSEWITGAWDATAVVLLSVRGDIVSRTREGIVPCAGVSAGCAALETAALIVTMRH